MSLRDFSDEVMALLQRVIDRERREKENAPLRVPPDYEQWNDSHQAPEVYIALPQTSGGITALVGSGTDPGFGDTPGTGVCDIYQIINGGLIVAGRDQFVFNLTTAFGQDWLPVARDKYGRWLAMVPGAGSQQKILFKIISADTPNCKVVAEVFGRPCGVSKVVDEDNNEQVTIYDAHSCLFIDEAEVDLIGRVGSAIRMEIKSLVGTGTVECSGVPEDECIWIVDSLCCPSVCTAS